MYRLDSLYYAVLTEVLWRKKEKELEKKRKKGKKRNNDNLVGKGKKGCETTEK